MCVIKIANTKNGKIDFKIIKYLLKVNYQNTQKANYYNAKKNKYCMFSSENE